MINLVSGDDLSDSVVVKVDAVEIGSCDVLVEEFKSAVLKHTLFPILECRIEIRKVDTCGFVACYLCEAGYKVEYHFYSSKTETRDNVCGITELSVGIYLNFESAGCILFKIFA